MSKIICVGLPKTGTTSLKKALQILGYSVMSWSERAAQLYYDKKFDVLYREYMVKYDAFTDAPWSLMYKMFDGMFDDCRFIYTVRDTIEIYNSLVNHVKANNSYDNMKLVYPFSDPENNPQKTWLYFENWRTEIYNYFQRCKNFQIMDIISNVSSWEILCNFLNKPIPNAPFPHVNNGTEFNPEYKGCQNI